MIDRLQRLSRRLRFAKPVFAVLGLAAFLTLIAEIFVGIRPDQPDAFLIPSALLFLWALLGYVGLNTFPAVPANTDEKLGPVARMKLTAARVLYYGLAIIFLALTVATLYMTFKLIGIWSG